MSLDQSVLEQLHPDVLAEFNADNGVFRDLVLQYIDSLQLPLQNKSVLELGSGPGFQTKFFTNKGCNTHSLEGRQTNVDAFKIVNPDSSVELFNLELDDWQKVNNYDVTVCLSILDHLSDTENVLKNISEHTNEFLIVELVTLAPGETPFITITENSGLLHASVNGIGWRPTKSHLLSLLKNYFSFVYTPVEKPEHPNFKGDYSADNDVRVLYVCSKVELNSQNLTLANE